jgi:5-methylcytosine-specific restriction enzyme subunit McrC
LSNQIWTHHEHANCQIDTELVKLAELEGGNSYERLFEKIHRGKRKALPCYSLQKEEHGSYELKTGYFIGVDWIIENQTAIYVAPKLNHEGREIDFIQMLFSAMKHVEVSKEINELFVIDWVAPQIEIEQRQDLLTPLLVVEFLGILQKIVRRGLKRSYYKVEKNLHSKIKGKILIGQSIKENLSRQKPLKTYCRYDEFGLNNKENRLLKKALVFVEKYLPAYAKFTQKKQLQDLLNYINPAFASVSDKIELAEIKHTKANVFYQEYEQAIFLAKTILKRFGYNISNTTKQKLETPPFWIDMSKLFELYVLGLLKDRFGKDVQYQYSRFGNELDYLLSSKEYKLVIDAKYKPYYREREIKNEDARQVSGYARLKKVYEVLNIDACVSLKGHPVYPLVDCLIVYPNQEDGEVNLLDKNLKDDRFDEYLNVFKIGVKLPQIDS